MRAHDSGETPVNENESEAIERDKLLKALAIGGEAIEEAGWLAQTLSDFDPLWELLTPQNRQRLVRALVEEVVVHEQDGKVLIRLADLDDAQEAIVGQA
jgi:hypothetical protein